MFFNEKDAQIKALNKSNAVITFDNKGIILDANENFLATVGYSLDEIVGCHHSLFLFEDQKASDEYQVFWDKLNSGVFDEGVYKRRTKDNREIWLKASYNPIMHKNKIVKFVKYAQDVTAEELAKANFVGQLEAINRVQAIIEFDTKGHILNANDNFLRCVGYTLGEVVGFHHSMFLFDEDMHSKDYKEFWLNLSYGNFQKGSYRRKNKDGGEIWLQASYNPIFNFEGKLLKIVKYATDITESTNKNINLQLAFENLSKAIHKSEERAKDANTSVGNTAHAISENELLMQELMSNIGEMSQSAKSIQQLTELMDSIAFQTNILAINAKIEAAQAGSKSFSVVANEVKELSLKSTQSSTEIKNIITKTVNSINDGLDLIRRASEISSKTKTNIEETSGIMKEIENSSMQEIKDAMQLIDK